MSASEAVSTPTSGSVNNGVNSAIVPGSASGATASATTSSAATGTAGTGASNTTGGVKSSSSAITDSSPQPISTREVGNQATWSLSSCKPGFGVEQLRDDNYETYWQSDGQLPHLVNIQFKRKTTVSAVAIYTDFRHDESYTPSKVSVRCGTNFNDLQEIEVVDLKEPSGWVQIPLKDLNDRLVRSFMVQIAVISNHQQGRDTHLRQIKIYSPVVNQPVTTADFADWSATRNEFLQSSCIR